jgi:hypothetical protein
MERAAAGGVLVLSVEVQALEGIPDGTSLTLSSELRSLPTGFLGKETAVLPSKMEFGWPVKLSLPLGFAEIEDLEDNRKGQDPQFILDVKFSLPFLHEGSGSGVASDQLMFNITGDRWMRILGGAEAASAVHILVLRPSDVSPLASKLADGVRILRAAQSHLFDGDFGSAIAETRKILDMLAELSGDPKWVAERKRVPSEADSQADRWRQFHRAVYQLTSPASHGDSVSREMIWTRPETLTVLAATTGLLKQAYAIGVGITTGGGSNASSALD